MGDFKKLILDNLLDRKSKQDKMGLSTLYIDSLDANIEIVKLKTRKICEIIDKFDTDIDKVTSSFDMMNEIIYKCVPIFQNKDLKEQLDVPTPYEVVGELLTLNEMSKITEHIMELHGITDKKQTPVNDEIKN